jgi:signal transduction histidine kinase
MAGPEGSDSSGRRPDHEQDPGSPPITKPGDERRYRFFAQLAGLLETIDDPAKLYKAALGRIGPHFSADSGAVFLRHPVSDALRVLAWGRADSDWNLRRVRAFLDLDRPDLPDNEIMAPILIGGRAAGVMAVRRSGGGFSPGAGRWLARLCRKVAHEAALREEGRLNRIVDRIKDETVQELRPKDLFYRLLHGLKSLTRYDHSSALLIAEESGARLVLHAEQIAWAKEKSQRIGRRIKVPEDLRAALLRSTAIRVVAFDAGRGKKGAAGPPPDKDLADLRRLGRLLRWGGEGQEPAEGTLLLAPLHHDHQLLGLLKIATRRPRALGAPEMESVARVTPHVASLIHSARRALSMEERIITAEKKHAMADLARAISHDVKNAIGAILPLAQQAREEVKAGSFRREVLIEDLQQIEQSARICQRIFDGMLQLARSGVRPPERAPLSTILDGALAILGTRLKRSGVTLELKLPEDLPELRVSRGGLEQLFLNLFTNALDSMPAGGKLKVQAKKDGQRVEVKVADTGTGIPADQLKWIHEPFYTTKEQGFGLGLAICRSILWENGGEMRIESATGRGTTVTVTLPVAASLPGRRAAIPPRRRASTIPEAGT